MEKQSKGNLQLLSGERGVSAIEVLVALAILALVGCVFLSALATTSKAVFLTSERSTAESLARMQLESIKGAPYSTTYEKIPVPEGYSLSLTTATLVGTSIQKITVTIYHHGKQVIKVESYKLAR